MTQRRYLTLMLLASIKSRTKQSATAPLAQYVAKDWRPSPEYVDCRGLESLFGVKPGLAYDLLTSGDIEGVSLKRRGQKRGKRLFRVESVRAFLQKQASTDVESAAAGGAQ